MKTFAENKRARFDYDIKDQFTAGLALTGAEVKSVKGGNVSLAGAYVTVSGGSGRLLNCHIGPYRYARNAGFEPTRSRQLLLTKTEISRLLGKDKGLAIIPLAIFQGPRGLLKLSLGLGRVRKKTDKREYLKKREAQKEIRNAA
ncbi:MAG TPA: SsrA-binding protein SmpB [Patescibacteria group bacterium]|nr:SsrA-binding protein SmpB [Patescibacteria group bacterium]